MKIVFLCALFVIIASGCATSLSTGGLSIVDADERSVINCTLIRNVSGSSGWGNLAASTGINNAQNEAREKAARAGATHIVWKTVNGGFSPYVSGNAYRCGA